MSCRRQHALTGRVVRHELRSLCAPRRSPEAEGSRSAGGHRSSDPRYPSPHDRTPSRGPVTGAMLRPLIRAAVMVVMTQIPWLPRLNRIPAPGAVHDPRRHPLPKRLVPRPVATLHRLSPPRHENRACFKGIRRFRRIGERNGDCAGTRLRKKLCWRTKRVRDPRSREMIDTFRGKEAQWR